MKPTRAYAQRPVRQTKLTPCGECVGKVPENFAQVLARCSSLAHTKYMTRHNAAGNTSVLVDLDVHFLTKYQICFH